MVAGCPRDWPLLVLVLLYVRWIVRVMYSYDCPGMPDPHLVQWATPGWRLSRYAGPTSRAVGHGWVAAANSAWTVCRETWLRAAGLDQPLAMRDAALSWRVVVRVRRVAITQVPGFM